MKGKKSENITIRVTGGLKAEAEELWAKKYQLLSFSTFLAHMVHVGLVTETFWQNIRDEVIPCCLTAQTVSRQHKEAV